MHDKRNGTIHVNLGGGITLGMILAGLLSWVQHKDIVWALIHAICSWFYVIYWAFTYGPCK